MTINTIHAPNTTTQAPVLEAVTRYSLPYSAAQAWSKVRFYEHIENRPSLLLRIVLPVPVGTTGCHGKVGDTSRCLYSDGGYLTKRMTFIEQGESVSFEIVEQSIRYHKHVNLLGGSIRIVAGDENYCWVEMVTLYRCKGWARWLAGGLVYRVIKAMHRVVLNDMAISIGKR